MMNANARAAEKAKTYDDFDWEKLIRPTELQSMYVSQRDLYLMTNLNLSKRDCEKKECTKAMKVEENKKHFYSSVNQKTTRKHTPHHAIHVALSQTEAINNPQVPLSVPPWGGAVVVPHQGQVKLVKTCPIDNFLTIFYVLMKRHDKFMQYLKRSPEPYSVTLITICQMFDNGDFAEGKCAWLKLFPGRFDLSGTVQLDLWGNEEELFVSRLFSSLETTFTSTCSSPHCPSPVKQISSKAIT